MDRDEGLPISVCLALCLAERVRDPSGCRASGLSPELPVHVVLVPPLLVGRLLPLWLRDFTRAGHHIVQSTLLLSFFAAPEAYMCGRLDPCRES